ncbi:DUF3397 domain-containing protein [Alkalihalobacillus sp. AL-G]|uniref:DUF3397 domain-containing protein n=1 Tax=Alkalihalobacillus sp. AL-G TaxID=2926399 RepID=UPI00272B3525|nr:DUF3397 domain-containing protein [Alkalihalobacillus sp. AL-G]WLD95056.1 DUF3397 domain-containing protein [Alkalihalobacillus sp. AL-G]
MVDFFAGSLATLITVPLIAWLMVYSVMKKFTQKKKKSFLFATDVTTFFLIASVLSILYTIWERSFIWPIIVLLLAIVICITWIYWKQDKDVSMFRILKTAWRFNFLLFSTGYLSLSIYGLVTRIILISS